jgi:hypothetical protein
VHGLLLIQFGAAGVGDALGTITVLEDAARELDNASIVLEDATIEIEEDISELDTTGIGDDIKLVVSILDVTIEEARPLLARLCNDELATGEGVASVDETAGVLEVEEYSEVVELTVGAEGMVDEESPGDDAALLDLNVVVVEIRVELDDRTLHDPNPF